MKTNAQFLKDEVGYPIASGRIENILLKRRICPGGEICPEVLESKAFIGALADTYFSIIANPNFSESDISVSFTDSDRERLIKLAMSLYKQIGEEVVDPTAPQVYIGE